MKIDTTAELVKNIRGFHETQIAALNGILDKVPASLKEQFVALRDSLNEQLAKLPTLEQAATQDAAAAFNSCVESVLRVQTYASDLMTKLSLVSSNLVNATSAKNALDEQITKGDFVSKDKVETAVELAKQDAVKSVLPEIIATRKQALEAASLPVPGDNVLGLPAKDYNELFTAVAANLKLAGEKGLSLVGKGAAFLKKSAWMPVTAFNGQMDEIADLVGAPGKNEGAPDPLLGNKGIEQKSATSRPGIGIA